MKDTFLYRVIRKNILAKFYCMGYKTTFVNQAPFAMGNVTMQRSPIQLSAVSVEADHALFASDKNISIFRLPDRKMQPKMQLIYCDAWRFHTW